MTIDNLFKILYKYILFVNPDSDNIFIQQEDNLIHIKYILGPYYSFEKTEDKIFLSFGKERKLEIYNLNDIQNCLYIFFPNRPRISIDLAIKLKFI